MQPEAPFICPPQCFRSPEFLLDMSSTVKNLFLYL
jgi:hypothetical protein